MRLGLPRRRPCSKSRSSCTSTCVRGRLCDGVPFSRVSPPAALYPQVAIVVYALNKMLVMEAMLSAGIPYYIALFIDLGISVVILDYITMPICSILFDKWLSKPRKQVLALSYAFDPWFEIKLDHVHAAVPV